MRIVPYGMAKAVVVAVVGFLEDRDGHTTGLPAFQQRQHRSSRVQGAAEHGERGTERKRSIPSREEGGWWGGGQPDG